MEIQYAFDPNGEFQKKLDEAFRAVGDLTIPLTLMANEWYRGNNSIFKLKSPGQHYKDLTDRYKKIKQKRHGRIYPILFASGYLAASITNKNDPNAIFDIENGHTLTLGTRVPYAIYHQSLSPRKKKKDGSDLIPRRPFMFVGVEQIAPNDIKQNRMKNWLKIIDSYVTQKLE